MTDYGDKTVVGRLQRRGSRGHAQSRRATLSVGAGALPGLRSGSLSPQRALRTRVLRERANLADSNHNNASDRLSEMGKPTTKPPARGSSRAQQMHFAFGSKVMKPSFTKSSVSGGAAEGRGRAVQAPSDAETTPSGARLKRERAARPEAGELQRPQPRAQGLLGHRTNTATSSSTKPREDVDVAVLKASLQEKDEFVGALQRQLQEGVVAGSGNSGDRSKLAARSMDNEAERGDGKHTPLDRGPGAALRQAEHEAIAEMNETILKAEAVAAAGLSRTEEMQASVDELIRVLKARRR